MTYKLPKSLNTEGPPILAALWIRQSRVPPVIEPTCFAARFAEELRGDSRISACHTHLKRCVVDNVPLYNMEILESSGGSVQMHSFVDITCDCEYYGVWTCCLRGVQGF